MARTALWVMLALAAGLLIGAAAKGKKFPYLSDRWNRPVDLTEIELSCIQSEYRAREPLTLRKDRLLATEIRAEARPSHIRLSVQVQVLAGADAPLTGAELEHAASAACKYWTEELLRRPVSEGADCPITIDVAQGSKVLYRQVRDAQGRRGFLNPPV